VREALEVWLQKRERRRLAEEIERYATAEAGGVYDLDREIEAASVEHLLAAEDP
jgi:hypothetical protein